MGNKKTFGHLAALFTIVIWGTTFISTKILLVNFKPVEILFFRFVMGFMILLVISLKRLKTKSRKEELSFVLAGLCGICLYYLLENIALTYTLVVILAGIFLQYQHTSPKRLLDLSAQKYEQVHSSVDYEQDILEKRDDIVEHYRWK